METPFGIIYIARNRINGKSYIGQTVRSPQKRWQAHISKAKSGSPAFFHRAIRKYGAESFDVAILYQAFSKQELDEMECRAIRTHDSRNREFGYNSSDGGEGLTNPSPETRRMMREAKVGRSPWNKGKSTSPEAKLRQSESARQRWTNTPPAERKLSEETKAKISVANKGRPHSPHTPEARLKISQALQGNKRSLGRKHSPETRRKMSELRRGRAVSEETRAKISAANKGRKPPLWVSEKARLANTGASRPHSDSARLKMQASWTPERRAKQKERAKQQWSMHRAQSN